MLWRHHPNYSLLGDIMSKFAKLSNPSFEDHYQQLSLEDIALEDLKSSFYAVVEELSSRLKSNLQSLRIDSNGKKNLLPTDIDKKIRTAEEMTKAVDFLVYGHQLVSVPEGFVGNLLDYLGVLRTHMVKFSKLEDEIIKDYSTILSTFISNRDYRQSLHRHSALFDKAKKQRELAITSVKVYFPVAAANSKAPLRKVMRNFKELKPLTDQAKQLDKDIQSVNLHSIQTSVQKCVSILDLILDQLKHNKIDTLSQEAASDISQGALEVGKLVQTFSLLYHDSRIAVYSVEKIIDTLQS